MASSIAVSACGGGDRGSGASSSDSEGDMTSEARPLEGNVGSAGRGGAPSGGAVRAGQGTAGRGGATATMAEGGAASSAGQAGSPGETGDAGAENAPEPYDGPTVGTAKPFAVLAYSAITAANVSTIIGDIGVSAGALSTITGFDAAGDTKYGLDSLPPFDQRTILAQQDVTALVADIDPRACDDDYTDVVGALTGDVTLYPGVTCMNSFSTGILLNGNVYLDARGDANAFFIIRGNLSLIVANGAQVVLMNGAQACSVFWRISTAVTIGTTVQFYGTIIAGSAITMNTGSTLTGRALAQTAGVQLDANAITVPSDGSPGSPGVCTHLQ
jgi:hypothetical protein